MLYEVITFENTDTIIEEIKEVKNQLEEVEAKFNLISDSDLIDALIFEQRSLEARYTYLLRIAKGRGIKNEKSYNFV